MRPMPVVVGEGARREEKEGGEEAGGCKLLDSQT